MFDFKKVDENKIIKIKRFEKFLYALAIILIIIIGVAVILLKSGKW
ncbi:MAG: hypothetical protein J7K46_01300 [Bacteroidales bacterium]|nr:hypothetical protein [Bacteroidales bacterium]